MQNTRCPGKERPGGGAQLTGGVSADSSTQDEERSEGGGQGFL